MQCNGMEWNGSVCVCFLLFLWNFFCLFWIDGGLEGVVFLIYGGDGDVDGDGDGA